MNINVLDLVLKSDGNVSLTEAIINKKISSPINLLDIDNKVLSVKNNSSNNSYKSSKIEKIDKEITVYIYNTHQREEYAKTAYNITPTVITASNILKDELSDLGIKSLVENRDIIKETQRRGYDYTGTYTVSLDYLKERKKANPSLKYFFDIHRDSVTGAAARTTIKGKNYATIMFLIGANYDGYEKHVDNANVMKKYLDRKYPGLTRSNYIQTKSSFYQYYDDNMFLVEVGGPDNTLEEVYNSTKALAEAIKHYTEVKK